MSAHVKGLAPRQLVTTGAVVNARRECTACQLLSSPQASARCPWASPSLLHQPLPTPLCAHTRTLLTAAGTQGFFGASTPDLLPLNPPSSRLRRPPLLVPPPGVPGTRPARPPAGPPGSCLRPPLSLSTSGLPLAPTWPAPLPPAPHPTAAPVRPAADPHASTYTGAYLPYTALCEGVDYVRNHAAPGIDFATTHLWSARGWAGRGRSMLCLPAPAAHAATGPACLLRRTLSCTSPSTQARLRMGLQRRVQNRGNAHPAARPAAGRRQGALAGTARCCCLQRCCLHLGAHAATLRSDSAASQPSCCAALC